MVTKTQSRLDVTGVPVIVTIMDSNNNMAAQVQVTSNSYGVFNYAWTPTTAGEYTIHADFEGTLSYGPSSAGTATVVGKAPTLPTTTTSPTASPSPST